MLRTKIENDEFTGCLKTLENVIIPLIDYTVFRGDKQKENRRNTISYDKDQKQATLDEGLSIYSAYASKLSWGEYFKLLKKLLFKLDKAKMRAKSVSAQGEPELEKEKLITKAICKLLAGFNFKEVPDAIE